MALFINKRRTRSVLHSLRSFDMSIHSLFYNSFYRHTVHSKIEWIVIYEQALSERNRSLHDRRDGLKGSGLRRYRGSARNRYGLAPFAETTQDHEAAFGFSSLSDFGHEITQNHSKQRNTKQEDGRVE